MNLVIAEHVVLLAHENRVLASATVNGYGWHVSLGNTYPASRPKLPTRRAWQSMPTRDDAIRALRRISLQLQAKFRARRIT